MLRIAKTTPCVVLAGLLFASACVDRSSARPSAVADLLVEPGVSPADVQLAQRALHDIDKYFERVLGLALPRPITVEFRQQRCFGGSSSTGGATADKFCVWMASPTWAKLKEHEVEALALVAHEHIHNFQSQLGCLPPAPREYRWFTEGMAVYLSWRGLIWSHAANPADMQAWERRWASDGPKVASLGTYSARVNGDRAYMIASRAVAELSARGGGDRSLIAFCKAASGDWRQAFKVTFGIAPDAFLADFDRRHGLPEQ